MHITYRVAIACSTALILAGCAKNDQAAKDSTAAAAAMAAPAPAPAPPPALSLADVAGKWQVSSTPESGKDTTPTKYVLTATADTTGWMIAFPSGVKVPMHVTLSGDSVIAKYRHFSEPAQQGREGDDGRVVQVAGRQARGHDDRALHEGGPGLRASPAHGRNEDAVTRRNPALVDPYGSAGAGAPRGSRTGPIARSGSRHYRRMGNP